MRIFSGLFLICAVLSFSAKADDLDGLTKRVEKLEKLLTQKRWSCSMRCKVFSSPSGTYFWSTTKVASGGDAGEAFQAALSECDKYFEYIRTSSGYTLQSGRYDEDGNASVRRNCVPSTGARADD